MLFLDISMYHITQNLGNVTTLFTSVKWYRSIEPFSLVNARNVLLQTRIMLLSGLDYVQNIPKKRDNIWKYRFKWRSVLGKRNGKRLISKFPMHFIWKICFILLLNIIRNNFIKKLNNIRTIHSDDFTSTLRPAKSSMTLLPLLTL